MVASLASYRWCTFGTTELQRLVGRFVVGHVSAFVKVSYALSTMSKSALATIISSMRLDEQGKKHHDLLEEAQTLRRHNRCRMISEI